MHHTASPREIDAGDLLPGTRLLHGQYQILEPLQKGGFAMTYVARDSLDRHVVIKECFPAGLCNRRNGQVHAVSVGLEAQFAALKQQFICEARGMAKLQHPHVVAVHQVFEENNTAYMALDYVDGIDLISVQEQDPMRLTAAFLDRTLRETLKAVRHIHSKGVLHRDIAPDNLRVDEADRITLIDFGAAEAQAPGTAFAAITLQAVKDGYSPPEFYRADAAHDFSSDLYSLGATFYMLITGQVPPSGQHRWEAVRAGAPDPYVPLSAGAWGCSYPMILTVDRALQLDRAHRPQDADQWLQALDAAPQKRPMAAPRPAASPAASQPGPELEVILARMVMDVNLNLRAETPAAGKASQHPQPATKAAAGKPKPGQWSDIFGNPIQDVTSWMIEQEKPPEVVPEEPEVEEIICALEPEVPPPAPPVIAPPETPPAPKSGLFHLISRCLPRRQDACPT